MAGTPSAELSLQQRGPGKLQKIAKGVPGTFLLNKGETDGLFHVDLGELRVFEPF